MQKDREDIFDEHERLKKSMGDKVQETEEYIRTIELMESQLTSTLDEKKFLEIEKLN